MMIMTATPNCDSALRPAIQGQGPVPSLVYGHRRSKRSCLSRPDQAIQEKWHPRSKAMWPQSRWVYSYQHSALHLPVLTMMLGGYVRRQNSRIFPACGGRRPWTGSRYRGDFWIGSDRNRPCLPRIEAITSASGLPSAKALLGYVLLV
jgi:hypothetical protein